MINFKHIKGNFLITSISQKISLIKNVKEAAHKVNNSVLVYGAYVDNNCLGKYFVDGFWNMPKFDELDFETLVKFCAQKNISIIIPSRDGELDYFSKTKDQLYDLGVFVMISNEKAIDNCLDKLRFYSKTNLKRHVIETSESLSEIDSDRLVVKERYGTGSISIGIDLSREEARLHALNLQTPIFQPFKKGRELSVDAYVDLKHNVKGVVIRERIKVVNGESRITTTIVDRNLEIFFNKVIKELNLYGHLTLQAIIDSDKNIHIIECNPRFGGASSLSIRCGLDSFYWLYLESNRIDIDGIKFQAPKKEITQIRYLENKYII